MPNLWLAEANSAVADYHAGRKRGEWPVNPQIGLCQRACRCLYAAVTHKPQPWARGTAADSMRAAIMEGVAIQALNGTQNAYHNAIALGKIVPGTELYFGGNGAAGHVVTVVEVNGDPGLSLNVVRVLENTSAGKPRGPGTVISSLLDVCGTIGSGRILAVVPVKEDE